MISYIFLGFSITFAWESAAKLEQLEFPLSPAQIFGKSSRASQNPWNASKNHEKFDLGAIFFTLGDQKCNSLTFNVAQDCKTPVSIFLLGKKLGFSMDFSWFLIASLDFQWFLHGSPQRNSSSSNCHCRQHKYSENTREPAKIHETRAKIKKNSTWGRFFSL